MMSLRKQDNVAKASGFTLVEVLVALVILAIALIAVAKVTEDSIGNSTHIRNTNAATWVASNVVAELQLGLSPLPTQGAAKKGTVNFLNQQWAWQAQTEQAGQRGFERVAVDVMLGQRRYAHVFAFLHIPSKPKGAL